MTRFRWALWPMLRGLLVLLLLSSSFAGGVAADRAGMLPGTVAVEPAGTRATFQIFWEAWDLVQQHYVDRAAVQPIRLTRGAIAGMLAALGDAGHTRFLSPDAYQAEEAALAGRLEGIGAEVAVRDGRPTVVAPLAGSPAQRAGLRPGDVIVRVDGQDVSALTLDELVRRVRGPAGTSVTLTVIHAGETRLTDLVVVRARITVPSVTWTRLPGTSVALVAISQFAEHAGDELATALRQVQSAGATAVILDLRDDPGGLRDEAIAAASQFLRDGAVLIEQDAQGQRTTFPVRPGGVMPDGPLVALVNEGTASAAEVVAGALQDHGRARLVGTPTFGTGTILSTYRLSDGSAVMLGTAEWLTPAGHQIWHHGLTPDIAAALPAGASPLTPAEAAALTPAQLRSSQDVQLLRALQEVGG
jgi:carboxyl-terminal processing protease